MALRTSNSSSSVAVLSSISSSRRSSFIVVSVVDLFVDVSGVDLNVVISSFRFSNFTFDPFSTLEEDFDDSKGGECRTTRSLKTTCFCGLRRVVVVDDDDVRLEVADGIVVAGDEDRLRCRSRSAGGTGGGRISPTADVAGDDDEPRCSEELVVAGDLLSCCGAGGDLETFAITNF